MLCGTTLGVPAHQTPDLVNTVIKASLLAAPHVSKSILRVWAGECVSHNQKLRLQAPNAGACVQSLVRELDPTCSN